MLGLDWRVAAVGWHYPGRTVRILLYPATKPVVVDGSLRWEEIPYEAEEEIDIDELIARLDEDE
jgi:hypothetical protein